MSFYDYKVSQEIALRGEPFYALIMAAARKADTENMALLEACWPFIVADLRARYNAPGGLLPGEVVTS